MRCLVSIAILSLLLACASRAQAFADSESADRPFYDSDPDPGPPLLFMGTVLVGTAGSVFAIGNFTYLFKGYRPGGGWRGGGWATGIVNVVVGLAWLYQAYQCEDMGLGNRVNVGMGLTSLAIGGLGLGFTIWASSLPTWEEQNQMQLSVSPVVMPDSAGQLAFGVGLKLANW